MPHPLSHASVFSRRPDRSLGWAALESKQAAALRRALSRAIRRVATNPLDFVTSPALAQESPTDRGGESGFFLYLPSELLPFPSAPRSRATTVDVLKQALAWCIALQFSYLLCTSILILVYRYVDPPVTVLIAYREWFSGWEVKAPRPVSLDKVPSYVRAMLVAVEDGKFYEHHGLDFEAFERAREINKRLGKPVYGGSTLTMQVARSLFLVPVKSYFRKYLEALTALELEALLPKRRILELYFGYAEWGKGLFGMESASRRWYGRGVSALSRDEAARLIALLSSPIKYGPDTLGKNGILKERYRYLSERFVSPRIEPKPPAELDTISPEAIAPQAEQAPSEPEKLLPATDQPLPSIEPGADAGPESAAGAQGLDLKEVPSP